MYFEDKFLLIVDVCSEIMMHSAQYLLKLVAKLMICDPIKWLKIKQINLLKIVYNSLNIAIPYPWPGNPCGNLAFEESEWKKN